MHPQFYDVKLKHNLEYSTTIWGFFTAYLDDEGRH